MLAAIVIAIFTIATIAVAALVLAPRQAQTRIVFDRKPDLPRPFGVRMSWIAIRTRDTPRVLSTLGLTGLEYANWATGLGTVYSPDLGDRYVYVTPPVNGWTFVVGPQLPQPLGDGFADNAMALLHTLGRQFVEVQYFLSYPSPDLYAWCRVVDGRVVRAYSSRATGQGWNLGKITREEKLLGLLEFAPRTARSRATANQRAAYQKLGEFHVHQMAGHWSIAPMRVKQGTAVAAVGIIGRPPAHWRPELERNAA